MVDITKLVYTILDYYTGWWLSPTPLKNMSSSLGMMTFPTYGKL